MRSQIKTECKLLILAELIEASDDGTLEELRYLLYKKIGFTISIATMVRMAKLLNMTKKKLSSPQIKVLTEFWTCDMSSSKKSEKFVSKT